MNIYNYDGFCYNTNSLFGQKRREDRDGRATPSPAAAAFCVTLAAFDALTMLLQPCPTRASS